MNSLLNDRENRQKNRQKLQIADVDYKIDNFIILFYSDIRPKKTWVQGLGFENLRKIFRDPAKMSDYIPQNPEDPSPGISSRKFYHIIIT